MALTAHRLEHAHASTSLLNAARKNYAYTFTIIAPSRLAEHLTTSDLRRTNATIKMRKLAHCFLTSPYVLFQKTMANNMAHSMALRWPQIDGHGAHTNTDGGWP